MRGRVRILVEFYRIHISFCQLTQLVRHRGEMFDFIVAQKRVEERQACKFFHQIIDGIEVIHRNEITHRDLKPEVWRSLLPSCQDCTILINTPINNFCRTYCSKPRLMVGWLRLSILASATLTRYTFQLASPRSVSLTRRFSLVSSYLCRCREASCWQRLVDRLATPRRR